MRSRCVFRSFHNAEHSVNGAYFPLEIHLVHAALDDQGNPTNDLAVFGVFLVRHAFCQVNCSPAEADVRLGLV